MKNNRVNEIDLLRFLAAFAVVFFHYAFRGHAADAMSVMPYPLLSSIAKYGYLGVELFFMISGFVILMTANEKGPERFLISRIVRLYPAFWACCTITFVMTLMIGAPRFAATLSQYLINMTMLSGFVGTPSIDGVYWSLFVELRFYALVMLLLIFRRIHQVQGFLSMWLVASVLLQAYPVAWLRFLLITDFSAFFVAGAVYYLIWLRGLTWSRAVLIAVSWALAVFKSVHRLEETRIQLNAHMSSSIVAGIVSAIFAIMGLVALRRTAMLGRTRWLILGALTYPVYLLHQNIGYMIFNAAYPRINAHVLVWGTIALIFTGSYLVHVVVEKKLSKPSEAILNTLFSRMRCYLGHRANTAKNLNIL